EILEDRLETQAAVRAWVDAVRAAPTDPLAELAASRLLDVQGDSRAVDDAIVEAAERSPAALSPRAARLLREAAARSLGARVAEVGPQAEAKAWARMGVVQSWRVAGPFGALRLFDLSRALPLDGPSTAREAARPDGGGEALARHPPGAGALGPRGGGALPADPGPRGWRARGLRQRRAGGAGGRAPRGAVRPGEHLLRPPGLGRGAFAAPH